ncbi:pre-tRNA nuclear export protein [Entophlyctis luteolus]|nr:pre-tRNA nuclear export protein [Entophlyctis luteolus]
MSTAMGHIADDIDMPSQMEAHRLRREEKDKIHNFVLLEGAKTAIMCAAGATTASFFAQRYSTLYRGLSLPFKVFLVMGATTAGFFTETDRAALQADREFMKNFSVTQGAEIEAAVGNSALAASQEWDATRIKEFALKNKYSLLGYSYAAIVGTTLAYNFTRRDIFMTQKFVNARLVGQFSGKLFSSPVGGVLLIGLLAGTEGGQRKETVDPYYERIVAIMMTSQEQPQLEQPAPPQTLLLQSMLPKHSLSPSTFEDEDLAEQAVLAALDPSAPSHKDAADFYASLKANGSAWRLCLRLACNPSRSPQARFVAWQVVEELIACGAYLSLLSPSERSSIRTAVFNLVSSWASAPPPAPFLRNKTLQILVSLMRADYFVPAGRSAPVNPPEWPTFFEDILSLPRTPGFIPVFLALCQTIHDEVASREILAAASSATAATALATNTVIKDSMRARNIPAAFVQAWFQILSDSLQASDFACASSVLRLLGAYVSWIDAVSLVLSNAAFLEALVGFVGSNNPPVLRYGALTCLLGICEKGMSITDKLAVYELLGATTRIPAAAAFENTSDSEDDFEDLSCRYVNSVGLELCRMYDAASTENNSSTPSLKVRLLGHLATLLPHAVRILQSEYDDVSSTMFPFIDEFLPVVRACRKECGEPHKFLNEFDVRGFVDKSLSVLLQVIVAKMRYDEDAGYAEHPYDGKLGDFGTGSNISNSFVETDNGEDEALFLQMRQSLRSKLEVIAGIDSAMAFECVFSVIMRTFSAIEGKTASISDAGVRWVDAELALHLIYVYKSDFVYLDEKSGALTQTGQILVKMMQCNIAAYPHPSIPPIFLDTVLKHLAFFFTQNGAAHVPQILESFVSACHHANGSVRARAYYLFLRFAREAAAASSSGSGAAISANSASNSRRGAASSNTKGAAGTGAPMLPGAKVVRMYAGKLVEALADVLYLPPPQQQIPGAKPNKPGENGVASGLFYSQLYVFEAVGVLIALFNDSGDLDEGRKQEQLLLFVLSPLMNSMQEVMDAELYKRDIPPDNMPVTNYLCQLITAIGSVGKGFPDYDSRRNTAGSNNRLWVAVFKQALHRVIMALQRLNTVEDIRDAARFAFQRLVGCVGEDILPFFEPLITAGLFSQCTAKELSNFLPSIDLLMHKFKGAFSPIMNEVLMPLVERIFFFLNQTVTGFDEINEMNDLRRSYFNLLNNLFIHEVFTVLTSPKNMQHLPTFLQSCLHTANNPSDSTSQKQALSAISKMVVQWGSEATHPNCKSPGSANVQGENPQVPSTTVITGLAHSPLAPLVARWQAAFSGVVNGVPRADRKGSGGKEVVAIGLGGLTPLTQFSQFIYSSIVPLLFAIPTNPQFDVRDAAAQLVLFEIANIHKIILIVQGVEYLRVLEMVLGEGGAYDIVGLGWSREMVVEFEKAVVGLTTRELQSALKKSYLSQR